LNTEANNTHFTRKQCANGAKGRAPLRTRHTLRASLIATKPSGKSKSATSLTRQRFCAVLCTLLSPRSPPQMLCFELIERLIKCA
jgi:hypothetical protein